MIHTRLPYRAMSALAAGLALLAAGTPALAQNSQPKLSPDLARVVGLATMPTDLGWARTLGKGNFVKVLIASNSSDAKLTELRKDILANGGSVYVVFDAVRAVSAMVPAGYVTTLAARSDVQLIMPNRATARTASLVQDVTGSSAVPRIGGTTALNGKGVGIAVLDSGLGYYHQHLLDASGKSRVAQAVDIVGFMATKGMNGWAQYKDFTVNTTAFIWSPSAAPKVLESILPDPYGHGSHVASIAAGSGAYQTLDTTGVAPGAALYDVRVLNDKGVGDVATLLAGIDWVMKRSRAQNIRVMNLSLAANSTDSFLIDPLARAARSAVAAGIVVVAAAGNAGKNSAGTEVYGTVGSPGIEPSVITVGAANNKNTATRDDDGMASFSSRGPTRGSLVTATGERWVDNLLKPDLVAPGNRLIGALAAEKGKQAPAGNQLATLYPDLPARAKGRGATQRRNQELMELSGTSVAAPAVAGAAALLLQANPGLTPPLVKAILQYSAVPLPGANLLQQGAGQLNVEGAVRLAQALRTDIGPALAAGTLKAGSNLLATGKLLPTPSSLLNGKTHAWSRIAFAGGGHLVSGDALFTSFQPIYDPGLTWVRQVALRNTVQYLPAATGVAANSVPQAVFETNAAAQALLTPQVVLLDGAVGSNSVAQATGLFTPTAVLSGRAAAGNGRLMSGGFILSEGFILAEGMALGQQRLTGSGFILSEGFILAEGFILSEGLTMGNGFILAEGFILSEGFILAEGFILSETLADPVGQADPTLKGEL